MNTTFLSEETTNNFAKLLKELSSGRYYILRKDKNEWYSIVSNKEWDKIKFHFELRWSRGFTIDAVSNINIRIHLESKYINEDLDKMAREYFAGYKYFIKGNAIKEVNGKSLEFSVTPDFSSEKTTKNTIKEIIKKFDSDEYQKCAKIAEEFVRNLDKKLYIEQKDLSV